MIQGWTNWWRVLCSEVLKCGLGGSLQMKKLQIPEDLGNPPGKAAWCFWNILLLTLGFSSTSQQVPYKWGIFPFCWRGAVILLILLVLLALGWAPWLWRLCQQPGPCAKFTLPPFGCWQELNCSSCFGCGVPGGVQKGPLGHGGDRGWK